MVRRELQLRFASVKATCGSRPAVLLDYHRVGRHHETAVFRGEVDLRLELAAWSVSLLGMMARNLLAPLSFLLYGIYVEVKGVLGVLIEREHPS